MIGHIYRIQHTQSNIVYIGSTFNEIKYRWQQHRCMFNKWNENSEIECCAAIYPHMKEFGIDQFKCFLVKSYEVIDRNHLEAYETLWIRKLKGCNKNIPFSIKKMLDKSYYIKNKEQIKANVRAYAQANQEAVKARSKAYREKNKEAIRVRKAETMICSCGLTITKMHRNRHLETKKHLTYLQNQ
jgi:hypothetical protein